MNAPLRGFWTREEFFAWAPSQEDRYEFDGFQPVAMTGGTLGHAAMIQNVHAALRARLRGKPGRSLGPDAGIETTGTAVRYPDALVTCSRFDRDALLTPASSSCSKSSARTPAELIAS
jgi:Putative restriction endonuclease